MRSLLALKDFIASHPLTRDQKLGAFTRVLRWQLQSRLQSQNIVPWIEGTRLVVRRGMTGATGNIYSGLHEFESMAFLLHFLRSDDVFADVGANIGSYSVLASRVRKARSFAFEPDPITFAAPGRNIALNGLTHLVNCRECALGALKGKVNFTMGLDTVNHVAAASDPMVRIVAVDTLDNVVQHAWPNLIKLDVEGFEIEVLRGASMTLARPELLALICERSLRASEITPVGRGLRRASI